MSNPVPHVDHTNHITFACGFCKSQDMHVLRVTTPRDRFYVSATAADKCTWIEMQCGSCDRIGQRKFYWNRQKQVSPL